MRAQMAQEAVPSLKKTGIDARRFAAYVPNP